MFRLVCTLLAADGTRHVRVAWQSTDPFAYLTLLPRVRARRTLAFGRYAPLGRSPSRRIGWHIELPTDSIVFPALP